MEVEQGFSSIQINALYYFDGHIDNDVYLKVAGKFLKISHKDDNPTQQLDKYRKKGVETVFLTAKCYEEFTNSVRHRLLNKISEHENEMEPEELVKYHSSGHDVLQSMVMSGRIDEEVQELASSLSKSSLNLIKKSKLMKRFTEFKKNSSPQYLHAYTTAYVCSLVLNEFSWNNQAVSEKTMLAALMADIMLNDDQLLEMKSYKGDKESLSLGVLLHPKKTKEWLERESRFFEKETLEIIELHHERPNGSGYPKGVQYQAIAPLTAVYIVCHYFVDRMYGSMMDKPSNREVEVQRILSITEQIEQKFYSGNFRKASQALKAVFAEIDEDEEDY